MFVFGLEKKFDNILIKSQFLFQKSEKLGKQQPTAGAEASEALKKKKLSLVYILCGTLTFFSVHADFFFLQGVDLTRPTDRRTNALPRRSRRI